MFEKEAEEYVIKKHNIDITKQSDDIVWWKEIVLPKESE